MHEHRRQPVDRPKTKHILPDCRPWLLITTRFKRRFVYNPQTNESYWKFPLAVGKAVVQFDIEESKRKGGKGKGENGDTAKRDTVLSKEDGQDRQSHQEKPGDSGNKHDVTPTSAEDKPANGDEDEEEYEEVIEEYEDDDDEQQDDNEPSKRPRLGGEPDPAEQQNLEFGEDDMAWQLAQMEQDGDQLGELEAFGDEEDGYDEPQVSEEEQAAEFANLMNDHQINPYTTWEKVIENDDVVQDERYTLFNNMQSRRDAFKVWSTARIQELKQSRAHQAKKNPKVAYLQLLQTRANPKLYWQEFKRKFRNEPEMKDMKLSDKEREKLYREHITRTTKMRESDLRRDLESAMKKLPVSETWHNRVLLDGDLPEALTSDVRYISLKPAVRDEVVQDFVSKLPAAGD